MSLLSQVTSGKIQKPYLILIHGSPGVGKSTFAADAPNPIFLPAEDGTASLNVNRLPLVTSLEQAMQSVRELTLEAHQFQTLVVDTLDALEPHVIHAVCKEAEVDSIEKAYGGYGKGHVAALEKWRSFIDSILNLRARRSMNVVLIAHSQVRKVDDLREGRQYDRYSLKLNEKASALFQEAVDTILFATYSIHTTTDRNNKVRAFSDGSRTVLTEWRPYAVAKNRYSLPAELPLSWEAFVDAVKTGAPEDPAIMRRQIDELLRVVKDTSVLSKVDEHLKKVGNDPVGLSKILNRLTTLAARA